MTTVAGAEDIASGRLTIAVGLALVDMAADAAPHRYLPVHVAAAADTGVNRLQPLPEYCNQLMTEGCRHSGRIQYDARLADIAVCGGIGLRIDTPPGIRRK